MNDLLDYRINKIKEYLKVIENLDKTDESKIPKIHSELKKVEFCLEKICLYVQRNDMSTFE